MLRLAGMVLLIGMTLSGVSGCGGKKSTSADDVNVAPPFVPVASTDPAQVKWTYEPNAITLHLSSNKNLNEYNDYRHSLMLCIYQLSDQNKFRQLEQTDSGLLTLLGCDAFDASVVGFSKRFIQPGNDQQLDLDRLENARYIGVVAGYASLDPNNLSKVYPIPLATGKKGGLLRKKKIYWAGKLTLNLYLDSQSIQRVEGPKDEK